MKKKKKSYKTPFIILPTKLSIVGVEDMSACDECMKQNEDLNMEIYDCSEECDKNEGETVVSMVRIPVYKIEEYFPFNEEETWVKCDGRFGKYSINVEMLDKKLANYIEIL